MLGRLSRSAVSETKGTLGPTLKLVGRRTGRGRSVGEAIGERGDGVPVAFERGAFLVGELQLLQQLLDTVLDRQQLPGA